MSEIDLDLPVDLQPDGALAVTEIAADSSIATGCGRCRNGRSNGHPAVCRGPVQLLSASVCPITQQQCVDLVLDSLDRGQGGWMVTPNLDHLRRCSNDSRYARTICDADLRLADGMPLLWASRLQGTPLPERVAGSDLIYGLGRGLGEHRRSIYLLGGEPGTAGAAADVLRRTFPGLAVAGTHCPAVGFERDALAMATIRSQLLAARPDLVFVALGSPKQEYLIQELRSLLPTTWWIGVGISFSFVCGQVRRAPRWMQRCGLEWVHRLAQEPGRLASRYLLHGLPFGLRFLAYSLKRRSCGSGT